MFPMSRRECRQGRATPSQVPVPYFLFRPLGRVPNPEVDIKLMGIPHLGTIKWNGMPISDGRFSGEAGACAAFGQFGGPSQTDVVGHADGPGLATVFHGDKD